MDGTFWLNVLMRWLHVATAVVALGGTVLMRFAVLPVLSALPNGAEIMEKIHPVFKRWMHVSLGLLLLSGIYNYVVVSIPAVRTARAAGIEAFASYHSVMGMKILLSLVLFGIAIMALQPGPNLAENRKGWLSVNVVLGVVILLLAAYLRRLWALPIPTP